MIEVINLTDQKFGDVLVTYLMRKIKTSLSGCYICGSTKIIPSEISFIFCNKIITNVVTKDKYFSPGQRVSFTLDEIFLAVTSYICADRGIPFNGRQIISCSLPLFTCTDFRFDFLDKNKKNLHYFGGLSIPL